MSPLEVALIAGKMKGGGVEAIITSYVCNIDTDAVHYTVIVDEDSTQIPREVFAAHGADLILIPPYQKPLAYQKALQKLFHDRHFDIVHAHINTLSVFPLYAAWRCGIPVRIVHNHNTAGKGETKRNILKYILRPFSKTFATELCACSENAGIWLFGNKARFTVMPNSIDYRASDYLFDPAARLAKRRDLGLGEELLVGHVGRFIPQKNHSFLLDVFIALAEYRPDARLLLVGSGVGMDDVKEKAHTLGIEDHVIFAGQRDDVPQLYSAMDVLLLPSLYEGKPLTPMEAQYAGLPCVVSDCVTKEIIMRDDLVSFISLRKSPVKWAEAVMSALTKAPERDMFRTLSFKNRLSTNELSPADLTAWYVRLATSENDK